MWVAVHKNVTPLLVTGVILVAAVLLGAVFIPSYAHSIDAAGRIGRITFGALILLAATFAYPYRLREDSTNALVWQTLLTVVGIFVILEGIKGWCALRAMGIHTPF